MMTRILAVLPVVAATPALAHVDPNLPNHDAVHWVPVAIGAGLVAVAGVMAWVRARK